MQRQVQFLCMFDFASGERTEKLFLDPNTGIVTMSMSSENPSASTSKIMIQSEGNITGNKANKTALNALNEIG